MITIFMEYRIDPKKREEYSKLMKSIAGEMTAGSGMGYRFYEGVDQSNLFVETFEVSNMEEYQHWKEVRTTDTRLAALVPGGSAKIHVWAFSPAEDLLT